MSPTLPKNKNKKTTIATKFEEAPLLYLILEDVLTHAFYRPSDPVSHTDRDLQ